MMMKLLLLLLTSLVASVVGIGYPLTEKPFPECTNNSKICEGNSNYPYCVQCSTEVSLCSVSPSGCGCAIPKTQIRWDKQGAFLDHNEEYMTRMHCVKDPDGGPDKRARIRSICKNNQLIAKRENSSPCLAPNTTCVDSDDPTGIGAPSCVANKSGSLDVLYFSQAAILLSVVVGVILFN